MLNATNSDVRKAAVEVLGINGGTAAIPVITNMLEDKNSYVRWAAVEALKGLQDSSSFDT
jgi:HEAT repeat protein